MANHETKVTITAVDKASAALKNVGKALGNLNSAWGNFATKMRNVGLIATGAAVAVGALVRKSADYAENILNASEKAGVAVESLQKLRYAAALSRVETEQLDMSIKFLNNALFDAQKAGSDQAKALEAVGIKANEIKGLKAEDAIFKIADAFSKMENGPRKVALATTLLGSRIGTALIPMLNQGAEKLRELFKELEDLGGVFDSQNLKKLDEFGDNLQKVGFISKAIGMDIASALQPVLNDAVKGFLSWYKANRLLVQSNIRTFVTEVSNGFIEFGKALYDVWQFIKPLYDAIGGLGTILKVVAGVWIASLLLSFGSLVIALAGAAKAIALFGAALMATPLGWFLGIATALAFIVYKIYQNWDGIVAYFQKVWKGIKNAFMGGEEAKQSAESFALGIIAKLNPLTSAIQTVINAWNELKKIFSSSPASPSIPSLNYMPAYAGGAPESNSAIFKPSLSTASSFSPTLPAASLSAPKAQALPPQHLDISMRIDAEGRPGPVTAKGDKNISFKANTGVVPP